MRRSLLFKMIIGTLLLTSLTRCAEVPPGTLMHQPINGALVQRPTFSIAVALPVDKRPAVEHLGEHPKTHFFFTLLFLWWIEKRGNWVTDDYFCSPKAMPELQQLAGTYLQRTRAFNKVLLGQGRADFLLESEVIHLYGTYYEARRTVVAITEAGKGGGGYEQSTEKAAYAAYGNAIIRYRLYDTRGGGRRLVWQRSVNGTAQLPPSEDSRRILGLAATEATRAALTSMASLLTRALQDVSPEPFDAVAYTRLLEESSAKGALRFVIDRASTLRTASEMLTLEHPSGRIVEHRIVHNTSLPIGRPGDWYLSRERPDGSLMAYAEYAALADYLCRFYELRRVDEVYHYLFFGTLDPDQARHAVGSSGVSVDTR
jgi:hypothetical protein